MKVLIATEGSVFSDAAVDKFCRMFGEADNTEVEVVSAIEPMFIPPELFSASVDPGRGVHSAVRKRAEKIVEKAAAKIRQRMPFLGNDVSTRVVAGNPEKVILDEVERWSPDLVIVGSHDKGFWQRVFLGSVSDTVVSRAPCSTLVVRSNSVTSIPSYDEGDR